MGNEMGTKKDPGNNLVSFYSINKYLDTIDFSKSATQMNEILLHVFNLK